MVIIQTVSLKRASEGSRKWFIVECRAVDGNNMAANNNGNKMRRSKRFLCQGFDDADAKAKALRFAFSTEGFGAFRRFLFGNREEGSSDSSASAASLTGSGPGDSKRRRRRLRGNMVVCVRANGLNGLRFAAAVCVASNGLIRSVSFRGGEGNEAGTNGIEEAIQRAVDFLNGSGSRGRAKIHQPEVSSFEGSSEMACRCCGQQQRRGNRDANFGKQISEDNVCSNCLKIEREEIVVIRIDEQGEYSVTSLKDIWMDSKYAEGTTEEPVCCVCGCEDNEDFEKMVWFLLSPLKDAGA